jgi:WD40 repeat protein
MTSLRLLTAGAESAGHGGDVFACAFTPDGASVLSAGWDGHLRLWEAEQGNPVGDLAVGSKPLSACAVSPDGRRWLSGSMDGLLGFWEPVSQQCTSLFLAHTRPISCILFSPAGDKLATAAWDRLVVLWEPGLERQGKTLSGHSDLVAGCRFTPDGRNLLSWAHDGRIRLWDVTHARLVSELKGHQDRVLAGAVSPDGSWFVSASRDQELKLWALPAGQEVRTIQLGGEPRFCLFLLDAESLVTADAKGQVTVFSVPELAPRAELSTGLSVQCGELSPSGGQIALGCGDGRVHLVGVDDFDRAPLVITATLTRRETATALQRFFGKKRVTDAYQCTCPACRKSFELTGNAAGSAAPCPGCRRRLRINQVARVAD